MELGIYLITAIAIMSIVLVGQQLLLFDAGILSLGTPAFFACGGYVSAMLARDLGVPVAVAVILAGVAGATLAAVTGIPGLQALHSDFFAVATLAVALGTEIVLRTVGPGGLAGMAGIPPLEPGSTRLLPGPVFGWLVSVGAAIGSVLGAESLRRRNIGAVIAAVRADENKCATLGVRPLLVKVQVFILSAFMAAVGGALEVHLLGVAEPRMASIRTTVLLLIGTILSGSRKASTCVIGSAFVVLVPELFQRILIQSTQQHWRTFLASDAFYGAALLAIVFWVPWLRPSNRARLHVG
jgi:branched-chain amino acid transport system permease protein